jgi:outer membrane protein
MKKIIFTISIFILAGLLSFNPVKVEAQELRIGVVDADLILAQMPELTTINDQLEGFVSRKRREFAQLETSFLRAREEFEQKVAVISESARQVEQERLAEMARNLQQFQMEYQNELLSRQESLINPLRDKILNAINEVSRELGLAYVLNRMVNNGDMVVLYMSEDMRNRYDITERVKLKLGVTPR